MSRFRLILLSGLVAFAALWLVGRWLASRWGADIDKVEVEQGDRRFTAARDEHGVWKIRAESEDDLWFAFGYLQGVDRDFQIELFRRISRGQLAAWMGASQLQRDRLMRLASHVARAEWDALPEDSRVRRAATAFVSGLNHHRSEPRVPEIFESRMLPVSRADLAAWEPWEVLAVARFHSWEFSYDQSEEVRAFEMERILGADLARWLLPLEHANSSALYSQSGRPDLRGGGLGGSQGGVKVPELFMPEGSPQARLLPTPAGSGVALDAALWDTESLPVSNAWILSEPSTALSPTLCNDPHLGTSWPSPLYPIRYEIASPPVRGTGFMLPGIPAVVIGTVETMGAKASVLSWGITMATFADTQDFVSLSEASLQTARTHRESYEVREPTSGKIETRALEESWTEHGPRVDEILGWSDSGPVALDWFGYRRTPSPLTFFVERNLSGLDGLESDLATKWAYPAVNFIWISRRDGEAVRGGHVVTGMLFERDRREGRRKKLTETEARSRRVSTPSQRPYLEGPISGRSAFLVTANQRAYEGELGLRVAADWYDGTRADRIRESRDRLLVDGPEWSQTDFYSPSIHDFVRQARSRVSVERLCGEGDETLRAGCLQVVSRLDGWDGHMLASDWRATVAAGWYAQSRAALWGAAGESNDDAAVKTLVSWGRSGSAQRALRRILTDESARAAWEKLSGRELNDSLAAAFRRALMSLIEGLGPLPEQWIWGHVHKIQWTHPLGLVPSLGEWAARGVFGDHAVSGAADSPGRMDMRWSPRKPAAFPATHAAVMRSCVTIGTSGPAEIRWANLTGVSGNPLSRWARVFPEATYFRGKLAPVRAER